MCTQSSAVFKSTDDGATWTDETGDIVTVSMGMGYWYEKDYYLVTSGEGIIVRRNFEGLLEAGKTHYGDPKAGCLTDEQNITLQGPGNRWVVAGDFCSPKCQLPDPSKPVYKCPSDIPTGVTAKPQCAQIGGRQLPPFCALVCQYPIPHGLYECGANATCKRSSPPSQPGHAEGVCTYDD